MILRRRYQCDQCSERWTIYYDLGTLLENFALVNSEMADAELSYHLHRTNHKLEALAEYVKQEGL